MKISKVTLENLLKNGVKMGDVRYIGLFCEYEEMRSNGEKIAYIVACLANKYNISESSVRRVVKRMCSLVKI